MSTLTLTQRQRIANAYKYELKAKRTQVYRVLYGSFSGYDPQGRPELNPQRKLSELWRYTDAYDLFSELACAAGDQPLVSNGLFPQQTFAMLVERLATLQRYKPA